MSSWQPYNKDLVLDHESWLEHIPNDAAIRGMFFSMIDDALVANGHEPISESRVAFKRYPRIDLLTRVCDAAQKIAPHNMGSGMHEVGRFVYAGFASTMVGGAIFAVIREFDQLARVAPRAFKVSNIYGEVILHECRKGRLHIAFKDVWNFTHYAAGIVQGALDVTATQPTRFDYIEFAPGHVEFLIEW